MTPTKKLASIKPPGMSDQVWKIFMAHKGNGKEVSGTPTLGENGRVNYVNQASLADLELTIAISRLPRVSLLAEEVEKSRRERIKRSMDGE